MNKKLYLIAGANGSGKTTLARELLANENICFLNADEYAKELSPKDLSKVKITAGKKLFHELDRCIKNNLSFAIETTLAGSLYVKIIKHLQKEGYKVHLIYVFLDSPQMCIARIKGRVKQGGHYIPDIDVHRRYFRSLKNFWNCYKDIVDSWGLYYNGTGQNIFVASGTKVDIDILNPLLYNLFHKGLNQ